MSRSLVYLVASTIDGFIAGADGAIDMFSFEGPQVPDLLDEFPEMIPGHLRGPLGIERENRRFDTVLMGRATYDVGRALGVTSPYPHLRQFVVSTSFEETPDPAVEVVSDDPVGRVRALKAETGRDVWLCGGGRLAATLADDIDELILKVTPVVIGTGLPLFAGGGRRDLVLSDHRVYPGGFMVLRYRAPA